LKRGWETWSCTVTLKS